MIVKLQNNLNFFIKRKNVVILTNFNCKNAIYKLHISNIISIFSDFSKFQKIVVTFCAFFHNEL